MSAPLDVSQLPMVSIPEVSLIVKHTFLEYIGTPSGESRRPRALSDTELLDHTRSSDRFMETIGSVSCSRAPSATAADSTELAASDICAASSAGSDSAVGTPRPFLGLTEQRAGAIVEDQLSAQESSSMEAKSQPNSPAPVPGDQQHLFFQQQPWVFVPCADYPDCRAMQAACWMQPPLWQHLRPTDSDQSTVCPSPTPSSPPSLGGHSRVPSSDFASFSRGHSRVPSLDLATFSSMPEMPATTTETRTTVMLRDLPTDLTRNALLYVLDMKGFREQYDWVYIPVDFGTGDGLGYAFINMVSVHAVPRLWDRFDGFSAWGILNIASAKVCGVSWSEPHQGLAAQLKRYQNSPVMHPDVPDEWKPALFVRGARVAFPPPTKKLKAPKIRGRKA